MNNCRTHSRHNCPDPACRDERSNVGSVSPTTSGDPAIGIGGGLAIDLTDGSLGFQVSPGLVIDTDGS